MQTSLLALASAATLLTASVLVLFASNLRLMRRANLRYAERTDTDRRLIEALEGNVQAQRMRGDAAEELAAVQEETITLLRTNLFQKEEVARLLEERIGLLEGRTPAARPAVTAH